MNLVDSCLKKMEIVPTDYRQSSQQIIVNRPIKSSLFVPTMQIDSIISNERLKGKPMDRYIGRCVDCLVERDLGIFGAVLIQGPKWCGKTTTAQRFAESSLSLSDPSGGLAAHSSTCSAIGDDGVIG